MSIYILYIYVYIYIYIYIYITYITHVIYKFFVKLYFKVYFFKFITKMFFTTFFVYKKMVNNYYQKRNKRLRKEPCERYENLSKEEKHKIQKKGARKI